MRHGQRGAALRKAVSSRVSSIETLRNAQGLTHSVFYKSLEKRYNKGICRDRLDASA